MPKHRSKQEDAAREIGGLQLLTNEPLAGNGETCETLRVVRTDTEVLKD